ncbi:MAG: hypothetical protein OHK0013_17870 [Sandaracinaceae bacterium]
MTDTEIQREIDKAQRNAAQLRALVAENERAAASTPTRPASPPRPLTPNALRA